MAYRKAFQKSYIYKKTGFMHLKLSVFLWLVVFFVLMFSNAIQTYTGFAYIDEIATLLLLFSALLKCAAPKRKKHLFLTVFERRAIIFMMLFVAFGLMGNFFWEIQTGWWPIGIDVFTCIKFPVALLSSLIVFDKADSMLPYIIRVVKVSLVLALVFAIINLFIDIGMGMDPRYGIRSFKFIFGHATYLNMWTVGCMIILLYNPTKNRNWIILSFLIIASSLRSKGLAFVAVMIFIMVMTRRKGKIGYGYIVLGVVVAVIVGWSQFSYYYGMDGAARLELTKASVSIANDYFPFGGGFATFGSWVTADAKYYSALYYTYGLSTVHGLALGHSNFLADTFWPTLVGELGWFGFAAFLGMIACFIRSFYRRINEIHIKNSMLPFWACFIYLFISSTAESAFFNPQSVYLAMCLSLVVRAMIKKSFDTSLINHSGKGN